MKAEQAERVTDAIIAALEAGTPPWHKPWTGQYGPTSLATGKPYRGINYLVLSWLGMAYEQPLWGTYKQAQALGGQVRKGEKSTPVILWKPMEKVDASGEIQKFMMMRTFNVFNVAQMDGITIPDKFTVTRDPVPVLDGVSEALNYPDGPSVRHQAGDRAYYVPSDDQITLPLLEQFVSAEAYAATALHEAVHSTGHKSRLDRLEGGRFGCESYAKEELVAEIGAAMLADHLGINVEWQQHAAYCASWLKVLNDDRSLIIKAAQQAQKAIDRIIGTATEQEAAA